MLELNHQFRIVDVHARLTAGSDVPGRSVTAETLERELRQAGIVRAAVFPPAGSDGDGGYVRANNAVARRAAERSLVAFARLSGPRDPSGTPASALRNLAARREDHHSSPDEVRGYAYDDRFHGFTLDPATDGLPDAAVLDALDAIDLPVVVHAGDGFPPAAVAETLLERSFPTVLAHFGGYPLRREHMDAAVDLLPSSDTLYLDTSVVRFREQLERAIVEHPDRVLFGSGAPATHPSVGVMEILTLDVPEDAMARVFSDNAARVVPALAP